MAATFTELLPATRTVTSRAMRWTPAGPGRGELTVTDTRSHTAYSVVEFAVGRGFTGRAVRMAKAGTSEVYAVRCGTAEHDHSCDCPGHAYGRGKPCKHVDALRGLLSNGWLDRPFDRGDEPEGAEDRGETCEELAAAMMPF